MKLVYLRETWTYRIISRIRNVGRWLLGNQSFCWSCISDRSTLRPIRTLVSCVRSISTYILPESTWSVPNNCLWKESDRGRESKKTKEWHIQRRKREGKKRKIWVHSHMQYKNDAMRCNEYFKTLTCAIPLNDSD